MNIYKSLIAISCLFSCCYGSVKAQAPVSTGGVKNPVTTGIYKTADADSLKHQAYQTNAAFVKKPNYSIEAPSAMPNGYNRASTATLYIPTLKVKNVAKEK